MNFNRKKTLKKIDDGKKIVENKPVETLVEK